jgi:hypothetical protein
MCTANLISAHVPNKIWGDHVFIMEQGWVTKEHWVVGLQEAPLLLFVVTRSVGTLPTVVKI